MSGRHAGQAGQASVELAVLGPLLVVVVLAGAQLLAAGAARELADHAAEAAAIAILQGSDPARAARDAVPGWSRRRISVRVTGRRVRVRLRPPSPIPGLAKVLQAQRHGGRGTGAAMSVLRSMLEHFVVPAADPHTPAREDAAACGDEPDRACAEPAPRTPAGIAVLAPPGDVQPLAGALGLALAGRRRAPVVAVLVWTGEQPAADAAWRAPALPAASRLGARLAARGHDARAAGRLAIVRLPRAADDAAVQARRAIAAAGVAPVVLALGGPRAAAFDALLAEQDLVVVATPRGTDPALARLALAGLSSASTRACVCEVPPAHPARTLRRGRADAAAVRARSRGAARSPDPSRRCREPRVASRRGRPGGDRRPRRGAAVSRASPRDEAGQAAIAVLGVGAALLLGALMLGAVARGIGVRSDEQRAADLAALAGARAMHESYAGLFEPAALGPRANPAHLERAAYLRRGRAAAIATARRNGARAITVSFPDAGSFAPVRIAVQVRDPVRVAGGEEVPTRARAEAELAPPADVALSSGAGVGEYRGPLAMRQGKPMRPDVAAAFDRMAAAARRDGIALSVVSGFRTNAEQAVLFARHPDPKWVAPPGRSLHRLGTELDLGPASAYGWLAANAKRFHFVQRYAWEPWHFGFELNAGTASVGFGAGGADGAVSGALPSFVPARFAAPLARAAQRWNVSSALLGAQLAAESNFNPFARSSAGALGIAQFMPATARALGLRDPLDAAASIDAQAHLMRDLLRRFGAVPLALAAYNAGPARVAACGCVPPIPETRGYVARVLGLLGGAGEAIAGGGLEVQARALKCHDTLG